MEVAIVGGGLVGALGAIILANRGFNVSVYEGRGGLILVLIHQILARNQLLELGLSILPCLKEGLLL
jgi:2-polyprenyl-6-methoxyphenol hydroxylase-like FAD-dependent oxidoreductase